MARTESGKPKQSCFKLLPSHMSTPPLSLRLAARPPARRMPLREHCTAHAATGPDIARCGVWSCAAAINKASIIAAALSKDLHRDWSKTTRLRLKRESQCNENAQRIIEPARQRLTALAHRCKDVHSTSVCLLQVAAVRASMIEAMLRFAKAGAAGCLMKVSMLCRFACSSRVSSRTESSTA